MRNAFKPGVAMMMALAASAAWGAGYPEPLPTEPTGVAVELPAAYPKSWVFVHDMRFASMIDGRVAIVDVAAETENLKGVVPVAQFGNFLAATTRPELYASETYYPRLTRGERSDVITIYDRATLKPKGEIALPDGKRGQFVTIKNSFQFLNNEKWALVFNFTPGASVRVVDLEGRKILSEIEVPGCMMTYPAAERAFATMCADGTMSTLQLGADGQLVSTKTSKPFNTIGDDPMFMMPALVGKTSWFVTFKGHIRGVDLSGPTARVTKTFALGQVPGATEGAEWRPGGWQVIASDAAGKLYVLMSSSGKEGSHKDGGTEVWVVDPATKARIKRIALETPGVSIDVTREDAPSLVVARGDGALDVYDAVSGKLRRSLGGGITQSPFTMTVQP